MSYILIIASALLSVLSFAPFNAGLLAYVAFVPLLFACREGSLRGVFLKGLVYGFLFFLSTVYWVTSSMNNYGGVPLLTSILVMLLLCAYLALYPACFALAYRIYCRLSGEDKRCSAFMLLLLPSLWVVLEFLRGIIVTGFPWVLLGYSQSPYLSVIQISQFTGVWGVSFIVMAVNVLVYLNLSEFIRRRRVFSPGASIATLVVLTMVISYGLMELSRKGKELPAHTLKVSIVQGNVDQSVKWEPSFKRATIETYLQMSSEALATGAELILWPETATPFFLLHDMVLSPEVFSFVKESSVRLLTGTPHYEYNESGTHNLYNSAVLLGPGKSGKVKEAGDASALPVASAKNDKAQPARVLGRYDKVHLVPFGEYVPLSGVLTFIEKLTAGVGDFSPGSDGLKPIKDGELALGVIICYEAIFPEIAARLTLQGANVLVNLTNDGWFGATSAPYQHLEMSRFRAVENNLYLIRAANTGISAVISPGGEVMARGGLLTREIISGEVGLKKITEARGTFFSRHYYVFPAICALLGTLLFYLGAVRGDRNRFGRS